MGISIWGFGRSERWVKWSVGYRLGFWGEWGLGHNLYLGTWGGCGGGGIVRWAMGHSQ